MLWWSECCEINNALPIALKQDVCLMDCVWKWKFISAVKLQTSDHKNRLRLIRLMLRHRNVSLNRTVCDVHLVSRTQGLGSRQSASDVGVWPLTSQDGQGKETEAHSCVWNSSHVSAVEDSGNHDECWWPSVPFSETWHMGHTHTHINLNVLHTAHSVLSLSLGKHLHTAQTQAHTQTKHLAV